MHNKQAFCAAFVQHLISRNSAA